MQPNSPMPQQHEIDLRKTVLTLQAWWAYLWKRRLSVGLFTLLGGVTGLTLALIFSQPDYVAVTSFVLESAGKSKTDGYAGIAARFGLSLPGSGGGIFVDDDNIMVFLTSRTMVAKTLRSRVAFNGREELLIDRYLKASQLHEDWKGKDRLLNVRFHEQPEQSSILEDSIVSVCHKLILEKHLSVGKPDKDLGIIQLTTISRDELFSKAFNEKLLENATLFYVAYQTKKSYENVAILRKQTDSVRRVLNNAISGVALSTDANPNPAFQRVRIASQKSMVDVEMNMAILEELVKNLEISELNLRKETPLVQIIDRPVLPLERKKLGKLKSTAIGLSAALFLSLLTVSVQFSYKRLMADP